RPTPAPRPTSIPTFPRAASGPRYFGGVSAASSGLSDTASDSKRMTLGLPTAVRVADSMIEPTFFQSLQVYVVGGLLAPSSTYFHWVRRWLLLSTHSQYRSLGVSPTLAKLSLSTSQASPARFLSYPAATSVT